ncbi:hypothetical protein PENTCL1PPCAC_14794, partial [Pristionchus entomophagus]
SGMEKRRFSDVSDVELLERDNCRSVCCSILIRLIISTFFLLILAASLIWSFSHGETGVPYAGEIDKRDAENFTVFINQFARNGRMTETFRGPDGSNLQTTYHKSHSFWYQDDVRQELVQKYDAFLIIYARKDYTFYANTTADGTITVSVTDKPNLQHSHKVRSISLKIRLCISKDSIILQKFTLSNVRIGEPSLVQLPVQKSEAFLVLAYADVDTGALIGYDTYFTGTPTSNLFKREYWYSEMLPAAPVDTSPLEIPTECADLL